MKNLKLIAVILSMSIVLSACVKDEANKKDESNLKNINLTGYPIAKEKITLKIMGPKAAIHGEWENMKFFKMLSEKTNIAFEFKTPPAASFQEVKNLAIASNELPDVFFGAGLTQNEEVSLGNTGTIIPLEELINKYGTNIKEMFAQKKGAKSAITTSNGHIYSLARVTDIFGRGIAYKMWFNGEWLKNLNIEKMPTTTDELYGLLLRFRNEDPNKNGLKDEIPLSSSKMFAVREIMLSYFGYLSREISLKDDKVVFPPLEDGYKHYIEFARKLYSEKLLDNEVYSQTTQQWTAKGKNNLVGLSYNSSSSAMYTIKNEAEVYNYPALGPLTSSYNSTPIYPQPSDGYSRGAFAITKACKNPEAALRLADYLYSKEGSIFAFVTDSWKWEDETKTKWVFVNPDGGDNEQYRGNKLTPDCGGTVVQWLRKDFALSQKSSSNDYNNKITEELFAKVAKLPFPKVYLEEKDQKRAIQISTDIFNYIEQMEAKFISGEESMEKWGEFQNNLVKIGSKELIDIYDRAYKKYLTLK